MKRKLAVFAFLIIGAGLAAWAQTRASMTAPVIKGTEEAITLITQFQDFTPGADYRIGVGSAGSGLAGLEMEIGISGSGPLAAQPVDFKQGYTNSWWKVPEVKARGFVFETSELGGKTLELKVKVPRAAAEAAGRFFVFVAKKYGVDTWYLEDGSEVNKTYW